jgi:GWxTD domain-containing protein
MFLFGFQNNSEMKRFLFLFIFLCTSVVLNAQKNKQLKAYLDHKVFYESSIGNYVEVQLQFLGLSLKYKGVEGGLQGEVAIQLSIKSDDKIVASDAYRLQTPLMRDSIVEDFFDLRRFALQPGSYELEVSLQDLNASNEPMSGKQQIEIKDLGTSASLSDIEVSETMTKTDSTSIFTKSGYEMIPRISNYFTTEANTLPVYFEIYATDKPAQVYGLKQTIFQTKTKLEMDDFTRFSKHEVNLIQPIIRVIDISKLPSGEYTLQYSLISKDNQEIAQSEYFFERSNEITEAIAAENIVLDPAFQSSITNDSVFYYLESLIPISKPAEIKNIISILKKKDSDQSRKYIQAFWVLSSHGIKAYDSWMQYKGQVQLVERLFSNNFLEGFETDRGRVYLQYGAPNYIIARESSPSDYPYEIWQYDKIKQYSNKRFIFYNPDLVNNNYKLLHCDMIGELQNYRWQQALAKRNSPNRNIDDPNDGNNDHFGGQSLELFQQK